MTDHDAVLAQRNAVKSTKPTEHHCGYDCGPHVYPAGWIFGGPNSDDPRADPWWAATVYIYMDESMSEIWRTVSPFCDGQALDEFTWVYETFADGGKPPYYLAAQRPTMKKLDFLPYVYDARTDELLLDDM